MNNDRFLEEIEREEKLLNSWDSFGSLSIFDYFNRFKQLSDVFEEYESEFPEFSLEVLDHFSYFEVVENDRLKRLKTFLTLCYSVKYSTNRKICYKIKESPEFQVFREILLFYHNDKVNHPVTGENNLLNKFPVWSKNLREIRIKLARGLLDTILAGNCEFPAKSITNQLKNDIKILSTLKRIKELQIPVNSLQLLLPFNSLDAILYLYSLNIITGTNLTILSSVTRLHILTIVYTFTHIYTLVYPFIHSMDNYVWLFGIR